MAWDNFTDPEAWKQAMANLLRRGGEVGDYIEQAPTKAGQAIIDAGQRQSALMNKAFDPTGKTLKRDPQAANEAGMNLLAGPLGFAPAGMIAYHGTPHIIKDKFDINKVGTGEGAQSYGHGMYFAEAKPVAEEYARELGAKISVDGKPLMKQGKIVGSTGNTELDDFLVANLGDVKATRKDLLQSIKEVRPTNPEGAKDYQKILADLRKSSVGTQNTGNLYKVDIPDEYIPKMLDYDKPIKDQPELYELVKSRLTDPDLLKTFEYNAEKGITGANVYKNYLGGKTDKERSENALALGIKGIRYLDEGSRKPTQKFVVEWPNFDSYDFNTLKEAQQFIKQNPKENLELIKPTKGTSNFVVFDPADVKLLERNNQPLTRKELLEEQLDKLTK